MQGIDAALMNSTTVTAEHRAEVGTQLEKLDRQEDQFLDLIGDPDWPKEKIAERMRKIRDERARLKRQLDQSERSDLDQGQETLRAVLELLSRPDELYRTAGKRGKRALNQAIFTKLYLDVDDEEAPRVSSDELTEPFKPLILADRPQMQNSDQVSGGEDMVAADGPTVPLERALAGQCSSNAAWVELRGFEPLTPSMRTTGAIMVGAASSCSDV
jgi:site-specific DNA recombinase